MPITAITELIDNAELVILNPNLTIITAIDESYDEKLLTITYEIAKQMIIARNDNTRTSSVEEMPENNKFLIAALGLSLTVILLIIACGGLFSFYLIKRMFR